MASSGETTWSVYATPYKNIKSTVATQSLYVLSAILYLLAVSASTGVALIAGQVAALVASALLFLLSLLCLIWSFGFLCRAWAITKKSTDAPGLTASGLKMLLVLCAYLTPLLLLRFATGTAGVFLQGAYGLVLAITLPAAVVVSQHSVISGFTIIPRLISATYITSWCKGIIAVIAYSLLVSGVVFVLGQITLEGVGASVIAVLSFLAYIKGISLAAITICACVRSEL